MDYYLSLGGRMVEAMLNTTTFLTPPPTEITMPVIMGRKLKLVL